MTTLALTLRQDALPPGVAVALPRLNRVVYVYEGQAEVREGEISRLLAPNEALHSAAAVRLQAGGEGAAVWRWELSPADCAAAEASAPAFRAEFDVDPGGEYLMRCDRVDFPLGGVAYTHTHQGPGIRCLHRGDFRVTVHGQTKRLRTREPWFEAGPDPVYAEASSDELTSFVRVMILPLGLLGKSSIRYVRAEDADKPKTQTYTVFVDAPIRL